MTPSDVATAVLLGAGFLVEALAVLGALVVPTTYDRVHVIGPASIAGPVFIATAVLLHERLSPLGVKAIVVVVVLWLASPVLTHATARATMLRTRRLSGRQNRNTYVDV